MRFMEQAHGGGGVVKDNGAGSKLSSTHMDDNETSRSYFAGDSK